MHIVGLDIGTTTLCAVAVEEASGELHFHKTIANDTALAGRPYENLQSPQQIVQKCQALLEQVFLQFGDISAIGVTGQMHGVVYLNAAGEAVSPLYTWQDKTADMGGEASFAQQLTAITGHPAAAGFGAATYFAHKKQALVPADAVQICTIHDYVVMRLCALEQPLMHTSDAASFSLFSNETLQFDVDAIEKAGLSYDLFPAVCSGFALAGGYRGVPVAVAIGDNQASFLGSVNDMENTLLINVGTGSQISFATQSAEATPGTENRPCVDDWFLRVGSSLCGGRAFAALEKFLRETLYLIGAVDAENVYPAIDVYLANYPKPGNALQVDTAFCGTRQNPAKRGAIQNLGLENFTPQHLIWGVLQGIVEELHGVYAPEKPHKKLVGSGNGLRKNKALRRLFAETFGMQMLLPRHTEEAAVGAALFALVAAGRVAGLPEAQALIQYET